MNHVEFWLQQANEYSPNNGWTIYENGTLVLPFDDRSSDEILIQLENKLHGTSGAGSIYGDFRVTKSLEQDWIVDFIHDEIGPILVHIDHNVFSDSESHVIGLIGRQQRNRDARERKIIYQS